MDGLGGSVLPYLIRTVDRYGPSIEFDLHNLVGLDLVDFFRGRYSWRKLADLIRQLPSTSRFAQAILEDEERAGERLDAEEQARRSGRRVVTPEPELPPSEYSTEAAKLDTVAVLLGSILGVLTGGTSSPVDPVRPVTAYERVKDQRSRARAVGLFAEVAAAQARWLERVEGGGRG